MNTIVVLVAIVTFYTWDFRRAWRNIKAEKREKFAAVCRRADEHTLRPMGFWPDSFSEREATWRHADGRTARVER